MTDLQVQCPIAPGSSGGGAFDAGGELVGVADLHVHGLDGEGFFVPVEVIVPFLQKSHVL
jgi:S1-C subfamily serine protease